MCSPTPPAAPQPPSHPNVVALEEQHAGPPPAPFLHADGQNRIVAAHIWSDQTVLDAAQWERVQVLLWGRGGLWGLCGVMGWMGLRGAWGCTGVHGVMGVVRLWGGGLWGVWGYRLGVVGFGGCGVWDDGVRGVMRCGIMGYMGSEGRGLIGGFWGMGLWHGGYGERDCRVWVLGSGIYEVGSRGVQGYEGWDYGVWAMGGGTKVVWVEFQGRKVGWGGCRDGA